MAGDDLDHDVKPPQPHDVDKDDEVDDDDLKSDDAMAKMHAESPAAAVVCADTLHGLSWLQCTRYKPPKLPSKNMFMRLVH